MLALQLISTALTSSGLTLILLKNTKYLYPYVMILTVELSIFYTSYLTNHYGGFPHYNRRYDVYNNNKRNHSSTDVGYVTSINWVNTNY